MQVSQVQDHITHAVIGGGQTIEFGISSSAEFFNILSSTLYKDQILAVVREVLCNANDAHIEAGVTDIPVEITLTEDKFIIKDFGKGIHRDDIGPIYGTYGGSTKKNDGQQTGGFGLGCKAPFAYIEHFEVISCHDGVRTIYNMSKSSGQSMGKPGIVPIASFPTTETGLQVTIKIKNRPDYLRFSKLINRIVHNGDMNMKLNGDQMDRLGFDSTKTNYMVTAQTDILDTQSRVMLRYGNVIYPVDISTAIADKYTKITSHLDFLAGKDYYNRFTYNIVFQAPPHSIAVTPSRESLSMQDHTVNTLNKLFDGYIQLLDVKFAAVCETFAEKSVEEAVKVNNIPELLNRDERLPGSEDIKQKAEMQMFDMGAIAGRYMQMHYPSGLDFRKSDIARRITALSKDGFIPRGHCRTFLKALNHVHGKRDKYGRETWGKTDWLQRRIIKPLVTKAVAAGLERSRLYTYDHNMLNAPQSYHNKPPMTLVTSATPRHLFQTIPYFRNIVVVSASLKDIWERAKRHAVFIERGQFDGFFFYHTSMKSKEKEAALEFFKQQGMAVVDLTVRQEWEAEQAVRDPSIPIVRKPPKKGIVCLSSVHLGSNIDLRFSLEEEAVRIENPEFIVKVSYNNDIDQGSLPGWDKSTSRIILNLFGDKGGITNNSATETKWKDKGAMMFKEYVRDKVVEHIRNSVAIKEYWSFRSERLHDKLGYSYADLLDAVYANDLSRKAFGIPYNLTEEDTLYLALWEHMSSNRYNSTFRNTECQKLYDELEAIPMDPANDAVLAKFTGNTLLSMIDANGFTKIVKNGDSTSPTVIKAIEILVAALNQ